MRNEFICNEYKEYDDRLGGRHYLDNGLWSHPNVDGAFYFEDERI